MNSVCCYSLLVIGFGWAIAIPSAIPGGDTCAMIALRYDEKFDLRILRGSWRVNNMYTCDGKTGEIKDLRGKLKYKLVISANDIISMNIEGVKIYEWASEYDVKKTPVWIDLTPKLPHEQKKKMQGLLKLEGDDLIMHLGELGSGVRPTDFKQHKGLSSILFTCKRVK
jgi:uncharacterized protein (TIGR03067 family)